jgi:predicted Zn-dependent protease
MPISRRQCLALATVCAPWALAWAQSSPLDDVAVYIVPLDDFPEDLAASLARLLQQQLGLRVKASIRLPSLDLDLLPGTNQTVSEDILQKGFAASSRLPEASSDTYRLFLTGRDINNRSANFRFTFSTHAPAIRSSVLSVARLMEFQQGQPVFTALAATRTVKMSLRAIGEMRLGWKRSTQPEDLMYAPIMGLADLDRIGLEHSEAPPGAKVQKPPVCEGVGCT